MGTLALRAYACDNLSQSEVRNKTGNVAPLQRAVAGGWNPLLFAFFRFLLLVVGRPSCNLGLCHVWTYLLTVVPVYDTRRRIQKSDLFARTSLDAGI